MTPVAQVQPFALENLRGSLCFCGIPTTADHEFCFCSTKCARADALRALDASESHYRKVFRRACVGPAPGLRHQASAGMLHPNPPPLQQSWETRLRSPKHVQPVNMRPEQPQCHKNDVYAIRPTLEQVAGAVFAKTARTGEGLARSNYETQRRGADSKKGEVLRQRMNVGRHDYVNYAAPTPKSLYAIPMPVDAPPRPTLRRAQPSTTGLKDNIQKSVGQLFHNGKGKAPENAFERNFQPHPEPSTPGRVFGHPINPQFPRNNPRPHAPRPLPPVPSVVRPLPKVPATGPQCRDAPTEVKKSKTLRRSASVAGWFTSPKNSAMGGEEALMDAFALVRAELRAVGDEEFDAEDYFKADRDDM